MPVIVFVNQLDGDRADYERTIEALSALVGPTLAPLEMPFGTGADFRGVLDLLANDAITYDTEGSHHGPIPSDLAALETQLRASLLEAIVVGDDDMTERYLEGTEPNMAELEPVLGRLMVDGRIVPVTCGSALRGYGIDRLASLIDEIAVSRPIEVLRDGVVESLERDPLGEPIARAFKVIVDPYLGRIVVMEVVSGTVTNDLVLINSRTKNQERLHGLHRPFGAKLVGIETAVAGDVIAVAKLGDVTVGDFLAKNTASLVAPAHRVDPPGLSVALVGNDKDDEKISTAVHRLAEEDPSLGVRHDPVSRRLVLDVAGDTHLAVTLERLERRFNLKVATEAPGVERFETIRSARDVEGRLKKQTGGHGQFAVVNMKVEPVEADVALEFVDAVVGGAVPRQYIGAVRAGIERQMAHGGPEGFPVVGLKVTLHDGKSHSVDSSEAAFESAAAMGLRQALEEAGTTVLERVMEVVAEVPTDCLGEVLNDLSGRRGRVIATDQDNDETVRVTAHVPEVELQRYVLDLRFVSSGRGRASIRQHHLAEAPKVPAR